MSASDDPRTYDQQSEPRDPRYCPRTGIKLPVPTGDDPAGAVSERTWTIYRVHTLGKAGPWQLADGSPAVGVATCDRVETVEVVSADWRAAALELADAVGTGERAFILFRQDEPGNHEGYPVAVYVGDAEACKADMEHRQSVNPNSHYYVVDKKLNPKSERLTAALARVRSLDKEDTVVRKWCACAWSRTTA